MTKNPRWRPMDFSDLEERLAEAKSLLEQAARLIEAEEIRKVATITNLHLDRAKNRNGDPNRRRYR